MRFNKRTASFLIISLLLLTIFTTLIHAEPLATSGEILAAEGNPDVYNFGDSSFMSRLGSGGFQVNLYTGSAAYIYPIEVPPGTNGLAPSLALVYNSQNTKGTSNWLGAGWTLSGLSRIERNTKEGVPKYDGNDTYVLDGEDLINISGNEYRTEIESYRKIVNNGNYWTVFDKSGTQYRYGYNTDSKIEAVDKGGAVRTWALDKITDTHGNSIEISYSEDTVNGDFYPSQITYTTGNGQTTFRTVDFVLEDRPDLSIDYRFGSIVKEDKRLKWVEVRHDGGLVRKYGLTYSQSPDTQKSLLRSLQVYGSDGISTLPSTEFTYQTRGTSWTTEGGSWSWHNKWGTDGSSLDDYPYYSGNENINSDGIWDIDVLNKDILDRYIAISGGGNIIRESNELGRTVDINGDGWDDLVENNGNVYINDRNQSWTRDSSWDLPAAFSSGDKDLGVRMVDANGDGRPDILTNGGTVWLNNGSGWTDSGYNVPTSFVDGSGGELGGRFGDVNGDGLVDILRSYNYLSRDYTRCTNGVGYYQTDSYTFVVWLNNGSGWDLTESAGWTEYTGTNCNTGESYQYYTGDTQSNSDGFWDIPIIIMKHSRSYDGVSTTAKNWEEQGRIADVNGDGIADILGNSGNSVYLSNGDGWDSDPNTPGVQPTPEWTIPEPFYDGFNDQGVRLVDMNNDGLPDLMTNSKIYLNNGTGWYYDGWNSPVGSLVTSLYNDNTDEWSVYGTGVSFVDMNGDGSNDIIKSLEYREWWNYLDGRGSKDFSYYYQLWFGESKIPDILSSVKSSTGGKTDIVYGSSSQHDNKGGDNIWDLSFSLPVVSSVTTDNGMTGSHHTTETYNYEYSNGMYDSDSKEFRGFGYVNVTDPRGTAAEHYFHQDDGRKGREYDTWVNDSSGDPFTRTENTWGSSINNGVYTVTLNKTLQYTYDGISSGPKITDTRYYYDSYGNIIKTSYLGDTNTSSDDREVTGDYYLNTNDWIVDRVARIILKDSGGQNVSKSWYYYDDNTAWNLAPSTKGELTKEENWLSTGTNPVTIYDYDSYGNPVNATDANIHSTLYEYDTATHTFPVRVTNARRQSADYTYDLGTGNLLSTTDPNGFMTSYGYDTFGRIIKEVRPYDTGGGGEITRFSDSTGGDLGTATSITFDQAESDVSVYLQIPKNSTVINAGMNVSGYAIVSLPWQSNNGIISGLTSPSDRPAPEVFQKDSIWYLIAGQEDGTFIGFNWTGTTWQSDSAIASGLGDIGTYSIPTVFQKNNTWYLISGGNAGIFYGFNWTGTTWQSDSVTVSGLGDLGDQTTVTVFQKDDTWYLIAGKLSGTLDGFNWTGTTWQSDSVIVSGSGGADVRPAPDVFQKDNTWYLIKGKFDGTFDGFNWTGTTWQSDSVIVSGLGDLGYASSSTVFQWDNIWYLIAREQSTVFFGFDMAYYPSNLSIDTANDSIIDWSMTGELNSTNSPQNVPLNITAIHEYLDNACTTDLCNVPLKISSDSAGIVELSPLSVTYYSGYPTKTYTYETNGIAPESVKISQREQNGTANTLDTYAFVDGLGRTIQTRIDAEDSSKQIVTDTFYNEVGSVENQSVPYLGTKSTVYALPNMTEPSTDLEYDPIGRNILVRNTDDTVKTTAFDHWKTTSTDENGHQKVYYLDAYGRIKQVDEKNQGRTYTTTYDYDVLDNLVKITDDHSNIFSFDYDSLGRKIGIDDPDMGVWNYSYDGVGNLINQTDAKGTSIVFEYDALNRVTKKDHPTDGDITYTYDTETIGTLSEVGSPDSTTHYYYDQRLRTVKEAMQMDDITQTTEWSYDSADRITSQINPLGEVLTFGYNSQGEIENVGNVITNIDYNALNKVARRDYGNSKTTTLTYNADDFRLNRILTSGLQDMQYDYDDVGNVISRTDDIDNTNETFGYDDLDRLTSAVETGGYSRSYVYDSVGNILSLSDSGDVTDFTYGNGAGPHAVTWWSRDVTPPTITLSSPTNTTYTTSSVDLNYSVIDESGIYWVGYSLDAQDTVTISEEATTFSNSAGGDLGTETSITFDQAESNASVYLQIPKNSTVINASMNVSGFELDGYTGESWDLTDIASSSSNDACFDGEFTWVIDNDNRSVLKYYENMTFTGNEFDFGTETSDNSRGITCNGTHYYVAGNLAEYVYEYDINGVYIRSISVKADLYYSRSLGWNGTHFVVAQSDGVKIKFYNTDWVNVRNISTPSAGCYERDIEYINGGWWSVASSIVYKCDDDFQSIDSFSTSSEDGANVFGITTDSINNIITVSRTNPTAYKYYSVSNIANLSIDVGNDTYEDWNLTGELNSTNSPQTVSLNMSAIQDYLDNVCTTDLCSVPLNISSDTAGIVQLDALSVKYYSNATLTSLSDGSHNITVYANDTAGNMNSSTVWFTIDPPPQITISSPTNDPTIDTTPDLNVTTDELSNVTYSWDTEGNISGCRNCTSYNTTYGENDGSDPNTVLLMHMNENYGTTAYDDVSNNDGTLGNATAGTQPAWTTGKFGHALEFDGTSDFVNVSDSQSLDTNGAFTLAAWIYSTNSTKVQTIIRKIDTSPAWHGYHFDLLKGANSMRLRCMSHNTTNSWNWGNIKSDYPLTINQWHFVACVRDTGTGKMKLYVDGEPAAAPTTDNSVNKNIVNDAPLLIGTNGAKAYFNGTIDEVAIYDRALSASELQELYGKALSVDQHSVTAYANDTTGNLNSETRWFTVFLNISITSPPNATISDTTPDLDFTVNAPANTTYNWDNEGNISGCMNCGSFSTTYGETVPDADTALLMHFNENNGSVVHDDSAYENDGTITNAVYTAGKFAPALDFDGSGDYVEVQDATSLNFASGDSFTMMGWIKIPAAPLSKGKFVINTATGSGENYEGYHCFIRKQDGTLRCMLHTNSSSGTLSVISTAPVNDSAWHHFAFVRDVSADEGYLYVDGALNDSANDNTNPNDDPANAQNLFIGGAKNSGANFLNGTIDELSIIRRALNETEIADIYNKALSTGQHSVTVYATDVEGNQDSATRYFTIG